MSSYSQNHYSHRQQQQQQQVPDIAGRGSEAAGVVPSRGRYSSVDRNGPEFTRLQLIDDEQNFSQDLTSYMQKKWGLYEDGFNYNVVSVFGSQSTGKSTLLNRLFGTRFDVMNEAQRQQTTRGIWADRGTDGMPVLILDVEGTDGRERGENQDFERKSALFSLAISEVLIVNMWEHTVGLYNGANMGLLKTVMEVNLQLFGTQRENKTLLYFVIRDHVSPTPLSSLASTLHSDLERIWDSLSKPEGLADARLGDYFDLQFESLPHLRLQPDDFERAALEIRQQFTDKKNAEYVFRPAYKRRVPADGFPHYAESVWEKVVSNKDLDLPTQQELLAQYRCDEIAAVAIGPFREAVDGLRPRVQNGQIVDELGTIACQARDAAIGAFDDQAARYHTEVYKKKRAAFVQTLDGELHAVFLNQVKNALTLAADTFANQGQRALEEEDVEPSNKGFNEIVGAVRRQVTKRFNATVEALTIPGASWTFASEITQLDMMLEATTAKLRKTEMERVVQKIRRETRDLITETISDHLSNPDDGMWAGVMAGFDSACVRADAQMVERMNAAGVEPSARPLLGRKLHQALWEDVVEALREEVADQMVLLKLRTALEDRFRYDEAGLPRVWRPSDDIDSQFAAARSAAQSLLPMFSKIDIRESIKLRSPSEFFPSGFDFTRTLVLISPARGREVGKRFGREADALYLEAKRSMVATQSQIPVWMIALVVFLGWNEAMTILFNPLYLVLVALLGGTAFVIHNLGLWGPVMRAANGALGVANDRVHNLLVEAVNRTEPVAAAGAGSKNRLARKGSSRQLRENSSRSGSSVNFADDIELEPLGTNGGGHYSSSGSL
ncbi:Dynamin-like GTPase that mediates homotypic ER fusion [Coemansia erecta]|uniref:Dynamin-like GTPase that mediates homotypic ER fusion n=1 Tax=Coemansia erecta TaxID=147472 RepID=A0A9W8CS93_9FUNG|nr:Dynamin-like GTPase that mediates homotypic ER fusion [Coemansia erecta]